MGAGGLLGTFIFGRLVARSLSATLILAPVGLAIIACALVATGTLAIPTAALLTLWGIVGTGAPVAWWTWVARRFPDDAEAGGGLLVAVVQLAITLGAGGGGLLFDAGGYPATFLASAALLAGAALLAALDARTAISSVAMKKSPTTSDAALGLSAATVGGH
jgi:predicted MFS family arabinose efflux permease